MTKSGFFYQFLEACKEAIRETRFVHKVDKVNFSEDIKNSTISYSTIGTGRFSFSKTILEVYENNPLLFSFLPSDIKIISTTACWIKNPTQQYQLFHIDIKNAYITLRDNLNGNHLKFSLNSISERADIIKKIDPESSYRLGWLTSLFNDR